VKLLPVNFLDICFVKMDDHKMLSSPPPPPPVSSSSSSSSSSSTDERRKRKEGAGAKNSLEYLRRSVVDVPPLHGNGRKGSSSGIDTLPFPRIEIVAENIVMQLRSYDNQLKQLPDRSMGKQVLMNKIDKHRARLTLAVLLMYFEEAKKRVMALDDKDEAKDTANANRKRNSKLSMFASLSYSLSSSSSSSSSSSPASNVDPFPVILSDDVEELRHVFLKALRYLSAYEQGQNVAVERIEDLFRRRFTSLVWWSTNKKGIDSISNFASVMVEPVVQFLANKYKLSDLPPSSEFYESEDARSSLPPPETSPVSYAGGGGKGRGRGGGRGRGKSEQVRRPTRRIPTTTTAKTTSNLRDRSKMGNRSSSSSSSSFFSSTAPPKKRTASK